MWVEEINVGGAFYKIRQDTIHKDKSGNKTQKKWTRCVKHGRPVIASFADKTHKCRDCFFLVPVKHVITVNVVKRWFP